ncbi:ligand-binding sensor domain-containing protein [Ferruginibacter sp.]|nr:histidine kinase [Ferruginibacter sp.]
MCKYAIVILICICVIASCATAQQNLNYSFHHINQADGLLHNQVFGITQDKKGFIWIASLNGLQRYDGSRFIYYPGMLNNAAEGLTPGAEIYADKKNNLLWTLKNITFEKRDLDKNISALYSTKDLLKDSSFGFTMYTDAGNTKWMLGSNAIFNTDPQTKQITPWQQNILPAAAHKAAYIFSDTANKQTWVAMMSKVFLFDEKTKTVYSDNFNPAKIPLLQPLLFNNGASASRFVLADSKSNIWVTSWGDALYRYDPLTKKMSTYFLSSLKSKQENKPMPETGLLINSLLEDDHNIIWVGTENAGLLRFNREEDNFDYCITEESNSQGIQYNYKIFSLYQDKEQNIWIGTDKGINIFNPYHQYFKTIRHKQNTLLSIPKSEIESAIQTTNGDIFIGTWGNGIAVYDSNFNFKKNIASENAASQNNFVWSFLQKDATTLWIGCQHGYLISYDLITGAAKNIDPPEMEGSTIRCMEKDNQGNIWFGLHSGKIVEWDKEKNKFLPYGDDKLKKTSTVLNMLIDARQRCWVSTEEGFKQFDLNKRIYTNTWLPDKNNAASISGKSVQGIEVLNDSTLIIGTIYSGINFFNTQTKTFTHLTTADGLPSQTVYAIKKDAAGFVWFTTDYGLYKFDPAEKKIIPYSMEPGVISSSFVSNKFYSLMDGQWLTFTTTEAISFFPLKKDHTDKLQLKTEITGFKVFDNALFIDSLIADGKPVRLSYKENFFSIEFAALNFSGQQQTNYYYRLNGTDKDWVNMGTKRFANYTDLQSGEYVFEVRAEIGNSTGEITSFKIIIAPPFWKTIWFRLLFFAIISCMIYAFAKWRINSIYKEGKRKMHFTKQMAEMEMRALRSQMNPHFIFNCINSIDALIQSNDKYHATVYLNKFAKLLRNILDTNKQNTVTFSKDIDTLKLYIELEELRHENKFKPIFKIDEELLNSDYKVPPLIIQPFVENAILHGLKNKDGNDGILTIDIKKVNDEIQYTITDNGIGRAAAEEIMQNKESHYGMQISYDRIKLFNKEENPSVLITDLYNKGIAAGTEVKIKLNVI